MSRGARFISHVWILASEELHDLLLKRRAVLSLFIYVLVICGVIVGLSYIEQKLGPTLGLFRGVSSSAQQVAVEAEKRGMGRPYQMLSEVASWPSPVVIMGLLSLCWFPVLVAMISCDMIAQDAYRGTLRFVLLRTSRLAYFLSKTVAHFLLYTTLYLLSVVVLLIVSFLRESSFSWNFYIYPVIRYVAVLIPFLLFLVASTQFISCWSSKPMKAVVRIHLLWVLFITLLFFVPWLSPLWSTISRGLVAPLNDHLLPTVGGMCAWALLFLMAGFGHFAQKDV